MISKKTVKFIHILWNKQTETETETDDHIINATSLIWVYTFKGSKIGYAMKKLLFVEKCSFL